MLEEWDNGIMDRNKFFPQDRRKNPIFQYFNFPLFQELVEAELNLYGT
jgi:hypothetical protein